MCIHATHGMNEKIATDASSRADYLPIQEGLREQAERAHDDVAVAASCATARSNVSLYAMSHFMLPPHFIQCACLCASS